MSEYPAPDAIVLGSGIVSLGVIIDLSADGLRVVHVSPKADDLALHSRWPVEKVILDQQQPASESLLRLLDERSDDWAGACILPTVDPLLRIVSQNLDRVKSNYRTPAPPWERLYPIVNKGLLYAEAQRIGIPTPKILYGEDLSKATEWASAVEFPVIIKPSQTPEFFAKFRVKAIEATNAEELAYHLERVRAAELDVMVSEIIPGADEDLKAYRSYIDQTGRIVAEMYSCKVRSHPPKYGVGIVQKTIPVDAALRDQGRKLLQSLDFRGFSTVEFKRDPRDGQLKLMEINPRPAMIQRLFRKAGINFAKITVDDLRGTELDAEYTYRTGVHSIHNGADIYHLKRHLRRGVPGIKDYFRPYLSRQKVFLLPPIRDMRPFLAQGYRIIKGKLLRKEQAPGVQL